MGSLIAGSKHQECTFLDEGALMALPEKESTSKGSEHTPESLLTLLCMPAKSWKSAIGMRHCTKCGPHSSASSCSHHQTKSAPLSMAARCSEEAMLQHQAKMAGSTRAPKLKQVWREESHCWGLKELLHDLHRVQSQKQ